MKIAKPRAALVGRFVVTAVIAGVVAGPAALDAAVTSVPPAQVGDMSRVVVKTSAEAAGQYEENWCTHENFEYDVDDNGHPIVSCPCGMERPMRKSTDGPLC